MRILQVTPRVPGPATDGGRIAMRNLAAGLRRAGAVVETLSLNPGKHRVPPGEAGCETVEVDTGRLLPAFLRSLATGVPPNVSRFFSRELARRLEARGPSFDVIQLEELAMAPFIEAARHASKARVALRPLNVESEVWVRLARTGSTSLRPARHLLALWLARYERRVMRRCDAVVTVTERDAERLASYASVPFHVAPVGLDLSSYPFVPPETADVCFLGALDYRPNLDGLDWFLREVWPVLHEAGITLRVAGSGASESTAARVREAGAEYVGFVPDARAFLARHGVAIVPLLSGGGLRVKIVEAMALGRAVVTTSVGAEGLQVEDGEEVRIADTARAFGAAVLDAASNHERRVAMGTRARACVERSYDSSTIGRDLLAFYGGLASR